MQRLVDAVRRSSASFGGDRRGNVAVIFSLTVLPLVAFVGAAIDFSHASAVKTAFQNALDSTALMLSKEAANETKPTLRANAVKYFNALFNAPNVSNIAIRASYSGDGGSKVTVSGTADVATSFLRVMNVLYPQKFNKISIGGTSTAAWGSNRLRVALVLDNTGSMSSAGKMPALKAATKNLLRELQSAASVNGDVYVSIIPFVKDVNVGPGNYNADWIYWGSASQDPSQTDDTSWEANNGSCSKSSLGWGGSWGYASPRAQCLAINNAKWTPDNHNTWNGCVMDRGYPKSPADLSGKSGPDTTSNYDTNVGSADTTKPSSLYPAEQYGACPDAAVVGLSYDWTGMTSLIDNMSPNGNTNQGIGLQLGWLSLVGGGPFNAPAKDPNYQYSDIIILLTDGLNTQNRWYANQSSIDARQASTCANVKAAGITLNTIKVDTDGEPTSTLLQNCASSPDKFYLLKSAGQIVTTFKSIATNLTQLRIAR
jgi:Flp pilus assembly protein TadG